jgi:hypothetical protein
MSHAGFAWECSCGNLEYGEEAPEECPKCFALDSFAQLPEEIALEREKELLEDEDDTTISALRKLTPRSSSKAPKSPKVVKTSKSKTAKTKRSKK